MALMVILPLLTFADLLSTLAAPACGPSMLSSPYSCPIVSSGPPLVVAVESLLFSPASQSPAFLLPLSSQSITDSAQEEGPTETITITEAPTTVTISALPTIVTDVITLSTPTSTPPPEDTPWSWSAPADMVDLTPFKISSFPGIKTNLQIVTGIPAQASALPSLFDNDPPEWDNASSVLQLLYPANSINPAQKPQGGAQFYATPLPVANARNVTFSYSVFFPVDFDWVLGGKLPGIYGGHTGCSGGDEALDCFSTRLMWREGGVGELYLYAPKDKQTEALCDDSQSTCNAVYGLSIGRGSFTWAAGAWTTVTQTVYLNTPGEQDGGFTLDVNGERVIDRNDVFYRDTPPGGDPTTTEAPTPLTTDGGEDGGYLDPILSGLLEVRDEATFVVADALHTGQHEWGLKIPPETATSASSGSTTTTKTATASKPLSTPVPLTNQAMEIQPIGFIGIFFSTFFGGHEVKYATPRDQYVWFKDFAMSNNSPSLNQTSLT